MFNRSRRGSQAVEFALVMPVLLALTSGIVDYAWFFNQRLSMVDAARQGARSGGVTTTQSAYTPCQVAEASTLAALQAGGFPQANNRQVTTRVVFDGPDADGDGVKEAAIYVEVDVPYQAPWGLLVAPTAVKGSSANRLEDQDSQACGPL